MRLDFHRTDEGRWYVDLPEYIEQGGAQEDLEMVRGADDLLNHLSPEGDSVSICIDTKLNFRKGIRLIRVHQNEMGATYVNLNQPLKLVWLCDVTRFVFNQNYPRIIEIHI